MFDHYAKKFDYQLVKVLDYQAPRILVDLIKGQEPKIIVASVLDLGCGTGLVGAELNNKCQNLEGIDLSKLMLERAREKGVYNKLHNSDILAYLGEKKLDFDYFVAADVFIYVGALQDLFQLIKSRNKRRAKLVFSTEHSTQNGFTLEKSGRYSHSKQYIEALVKKFGCRIVHFSLTNLRKDNGTYLKGGMYVVQF